MNRRTLIRSALALPLAAVFGSPVLARSRKDIERMQQEWQALLGPGFSPPDPATSLELTEAQWRERLNKWAGGIDTYQDIYNEVRNNPHTLAENVEPRRWWKG